MIYQVSAYRITVSALVTIVMASGCGDTLHEPLSPVVGAPTNTTPAQALRVLEWSWNQRDTTSYRDLFTNDYAFIFSALDPYGIAYRDTLWSLVDERIFAAQFFRLGTRYDPPASDVVLSLDQNFSIQADPRPGKDSLWHKMVHTSLSLSATTPNAGYLITGFATFFLVRGDSAATMAALAARRLAAPDSAHWYIDRWEDDSATGVGASPMPARRFTIGSLKAIYREDGAPAGP